MTDQPNTNKPTCTRISKTRSSKCKLTDAVGNGVVPVCWDDLVVYLFLALQSFTRGVVGKHESITARSGHYGAIDDNICAQNPVGRVWQRSTEDC